MSDGRQRPSLEPWLPLQGWAACCDPHPLLRARSLALRYGPTVAFDEVTLGQSNLSETRHPSRTGRTEKGKIRQGKGF